MEVANSTADASRASHSAAQRRSITEKNLQAAVEECARLFGWLVFHPRYSFGSTPGFPDLVLVRPPHVWFVELKSATGRLSEAQEEWQDALVECPGVGYTVWRPEDWLMGRIEATLR